MESIAKYFESLKERHLRVIALKHPKSQKKLKPLLLQV